jgi:hypothetical protein
LSSIAKFNLVVSEYFQNNDKQKPLKGHQNPVLTAQHSSATCCRRCIPKWHGIEKGRALNEKEVDYFVASIMGWIEMQI